MSKTVIGIDPGKMGGIAHVKNGWPYAVQMPPGLPELDAYIKQLRENNDDIIAFIEKQQIFDTDEEAGGKKYGIQKMLANYEQLKSCLTFNNIPFVEVPAQTWQASLQITRRGQEKKERKKIYKEFAGRVFPAAKINLQTADALCLAYFGMQKLKFDPGWVNQKTVKRKAGLF